MPALLCACTRLWLENSFCLPSIIMYLHRPQPAATSRQNHSYFSGAKRYSPLWLSNWFCLPSIMDYYRPAGTSQPDENHSYFLSSSKDIHPLPWMVRLSINLFCLPSIMDYYRAAHRRQPGSQMKTCRPSLNLEPVHIAGQRHYYPSMQPKSMQPNFLTRRNSTYCLNSPGYQFLWMVSWMQPNSWYSQLIAASCCSLLDFCLFVGFLEKDSRYNFAIFLSTHYYSGFKTKDNMRW